MDRKISSIINIRTFHNWVKRELINQSVQLIKKKQSYDISLLDLSVGKGGDMQKWYDNRIYKVVGFDISKSSIDEAKSRYNELIKRLKKKNINKLPDYQFYVMDLSKPENLSEIQKILGKKLFNIISCNFAIHYFYDKLESLNNIMNIVGKYIATNGFFIGTTLNGNKLHKIFENKKTIGNDIYKIKNQTDNIVMPYGNLYTVQLGKTSDKDHYFVDNTSHEYLVDIEELTNLANGNKLNYINSVDFDDWYLLYSKNINSSAKLSTDQSEFSFLNFSFAFTADLR